MQKSILSCLLWSSRICVLHDRGDPISDFAFILRRDGISYFAIISVAVFKILRPFPFVFQYLISSDGILPLFFMKVVCHCHF